MKQDLVIIQKNSSPGPDIKTYVLFGALKPKVIMIYCGNAPKVVENKVLTV